MDKKDKSSKSSRSGASEDNGSVGTNHSHFESAKSICQNPQILFEDNSLLTLMCNLSKDLEDFPGLLYSFFDSHGKSSLLIKWAVTQEVESATDPNEIFRGNSSFTTKLFTRLFFGDLGKRFLSNLVVPFITIIINSQKSLEIDPDKAKEGVNTEANLNLLLESMDKLISKLHEDVDTCPLPLREGFMLLKEAAGNKFPNADATNLVGSVFFLRFICPTMVSPVKRGIIDGDKVTVDEVGSRNLVIASKLFQLCANGIEWESSRAHSNIVNPYVQKANKTIRGFIDQLTDTKAIRLCKKVIEASVASVPLSSIREAESNLVSYLQECHLQKQIEKHAKYQDKESFLMKLYYSDEWKLIKQSKKYECTVYTKKTEGSQIMASKSIIRLPIPVHKVSTFVSSFEDVYSMDDRVISIKLLEKDEENDWDDWHINVSVPFPLSNRDMIIRRHWRQESENRCYFCSYSVTRDDTPPVKNIVRIEMIIQAMFVEKDPDDPNYSIFTRIYQADPKGKLPLWFVNQTAAADFSNLKSRRKWLIKQLNDKPMDKKRSDSESVQPTQ